MSYVIGIDAGGTSVRVSLAVETNDGVRVMMEHQGAAHVDGGPETLADPVRATLDAGGIASSDVRAVCAGITKITRAGVAKAWESRLTALLPRARSIVVPDFVVAFHGAVEGGVGIAVIAGTGSVVYGEDARGGSRRVGGRGWEYGDEGSGAWMTTEMLRRTLRALDGIDPTTPLIGAVCETLGTHDAILLGEAARQRSAIKGRGFLVPLALRRAQAGDDEAGNLFVGAAGWLGAQVKATAAHLDLTGQETLRIATVGGLWEAGDLLVEPFRSVVTRWLPQADIRFPDAAPVVGAARRAARLIR